MYVRLKEIDRDEITAVSISLRREQKRPYFSRRLREEDDSSLSNLAVAFKSDVAIKLKWN